MNRPASRLYRQGRDQDTIQTTLVHWWTALEYLVRRSQAGSGIGKSVESNLAPVIGLSHVPKLLIVVRNLLTDVGIGLVDAAVLPLDLRAQSLGRLWEAFKDPRKQAVIHAG